MFPKMKPGKKARLIVFALLACLVAAALIFWDAHKKELIQTELTRRVARETGGLYQINYDRFELDEVAGSLQVTGLTLSYDSSIYLQQLAAGEPPSLLFRVYIPSLLVLRVETPRAIISKEIAGDSLRITDPEIEIFYTGMGKDSLRHIPPEAVYRQLLGQLQLIRVKELEIQNARLLIKRISSTDTILAFSGLSAAFHDLLIEANTGRDTSRILFSKSMELVVQKLEWREKRGLYRFGAEKLLLNSANRSLQLDSFYMQPLLSETAFMAKVGVQLDRIELRFAGVQLAGLNFPALLQERLEADHLIMQNVGVNVYKDHAQPRDNINRVGNFPQQALLKLPIAVTIAQATIKNAVVVYKQHTPKTGQTGAVGFHAIHARISNITNEPEQINSNPFLIADTRSLFMNRVELKARFRFNLAASNGEFNITAKLGAFPAPLLNDIIVPLAAAKIEKGRIRGATLSITGSDYKGRARITLPYRDIKIAVLKKSGDSLQKKNLLSLGANFILISNNPRKTGPPREGRGEFERDTNRAFFNLVWKSLYVAIADAMGLSAKTSAEK